MGTRGLIRLCDEHGKVYAVVYNHWDSYPSCLGLRLYKFLDGFTFSAGMEMNSSKLHSVRKYTDFLTFITEGNHFDTPRQEILINATKSALEHAQLSAMQDSSGGNTSPVSSKRANGVGCLYAQLIAHLKVDIGSVYLHPADADERDQFLLEYVYEIKTNEQDGTITIAVNNEEPLKLDAWEARCLRTEDDEEDDNVTEDVETKTAAQPASVE